MYTLIFTWPWRNRDFAKLYWILSFTHREMKIVQELVSKSCNRSLIPPQLQFSYLVLRRITISSMMYKRKVKYLAKGTYSKWTFKQGKPTFGLPKMNVLLQRYCLSTRFENFVVCIEAFFLNHQNTFNMKMSSKNFQKRCRLLRGIRKEYYFVGCLWVYTKKR